MAFMRLVRFTLAPSKASIAQAMADDLIPAIKAQPGCADATFFGGAEDGECGLVVHWGTQAQADAASAVIGSRLAKHLEGNITGAPEMHLFPVIAS